MKYLHLLTKALEKKISVMLPDKFVLIFDGWSLDGAGTHYVAIFAQWIDPQGILLYCSYFRIIFMVAGKIQKVLIAFTPLLEEDDMSSEAHLELIEFVLGLFGKLLSNVICFVGDNCNVNKHLADLAGIPLIGCAAHRFNLAVKEFLEEHDILLTKVTFSFLIHFSFHFSHVR